MSGPQPRSWSIFLIAWSETFTQVAYWWLFYHLKLLVVTLTLTKCKASEKKQTEKESVSVVSSCKAIPVCLIVACLVHRSSFSL